MTVSTRSYLTAGVAAMVVGATAIVPLQRSAPTSISAEAVRLSAAVQPLVSQVNAAAATLGQVDTAAAVATPTQPRAQAAVQANNNASDAIDAAYSVIMYWSNYLVLDVAPYLLGWIPFGYLISDQINIWYPTFTVPVANSFVYDFLDPVVNDFWNPTVWRDGLTAIAQTAFSGLGTVVNQEISYFWSLAWFPFPLPPLPPLAALAATKTAAAASTTAKTTTATTGMGHSGRYQVATTSTDTPTTNTGTDTTDTLTPTAATTTAATTTQDTSAAKTSGKSTSSSKSGSATSGSVTGNKSGTAGSARSHGAKAAKGDGS
ncbi:hypothetical protein [Mycolicibacterium sphagni]|uniref:Uncharacterized protein n=1 Tax=Mycolicibacterium sphagni TaxID=1786 RepID=A0A255DNH9_9MYCO|nr:hypothetical protein [Mycolicibacterium sphagni]OYN80241.1 hypothetical protein CG716_08775 [Mycolicibacterium sphagni]